MPFLIASYSNPPTETICIFLLISSVRRWFVRFYLVLSACKMLSWGPINAETYFVQSVSNCLQMQGHRELMSFFLIRMSHKNGLSTLNPPHTGEFPGGFFLFNKNKIKWKLAWWNLVRTVFPWDALAEKYRSAVFEDHRVSSTHSIVLQKQASPCFQRSFPALWMDSSMPFGLFLVTSCAPTWCLVSMFWGFFWFFCNILFSPQTKQIRSYLTCCLHKTFSL